jgi:hypothetical protein
MRAISIELLLSNSPRPSFPERVEIPYLGQHGIIDSYIQRSIGLFHVEHLSPSRGGKRPSG